MLRSLGLAGMMTLVLLTASARAFDILDPDYGGRVEPYAARLAIAEARREPIRIGPTECNSSCTLYLASRRSCVSADSVFGFHAPWFGSPDSGVVDRRMTALFAHSYKPALRRIFLAHVRSTGYAAPGPMLRVTGRQLAALGYRLCP